MAQTKIASSATGSPISDVPTKNQVKPVRSIAKPEKPASTLPGNAQSEVEEAELARRVICRGERRHVSDQHYRRESVGEAVDADRDGECPECGATVASVRGEVGEAQVRGRARHRADQEARQHADPRNESAGREGAAERYPEAGRVPGRARRAATLLLIQQFPS